MVLARIKNDNKVLHLYEASQVVRTYMMYFKNLISNQRIHRFFLMTFLMGLIFYSQSSYAQVTINAATMLENLSKVIPNLMQLVTAFAYVMGMFFIIKGIMGLKHFGEMRTQMSAQHELKTPLIYLAVGGALLYLPTSVQVGLSTFWSHPNPYGYQEASEGKWENLWESIYLILQLVGTIAFIRGLVLFTHLGGHSGQPGTFGKALAHIIGGVFCINMYQFVQVVTNTLGLGQV